MPDKIDQEIITILSDCGSKTPEKLAACILILANRLQKVENELTEIKEEVK